MYQVSTVRTGDCFAGVINFLWTNTAKVCVLIISFFSRYEANCAQLVCMLGGIQGIKWERFNLWWSNSVERKNIIFTSKAIPGVNVDRANCMIVKTNAAYMIVISACITGDRFSSSEDNFTCRTFVIELNWIELKGIFSAISYILMYSQ